MTNYNNIQNFANSNPFDLFEKLYNDALKKIDPTIMTLASASEDINGNIYPNARIVLLKSFSEQGFVFYTNLQSYKSSHILTNPNVALCFHWDNIQIRIEGSVIEVSNEEADEYFVTRPFLSKIGAWSSRQSRKLTSMVTIKYMLAKNLCKFFVTGKINTIARPPYWSGLRVIPRKIEFWSDGGVGRIHSRILFQRTLDCKNELYNKKYVSNIYNIDKDPNIEDLHHRLNISYDEFEIGNWESCFLYP